MTVLSTREQPPQIVRAPAAGPRPAAAPAASGMTATDFLRIIRKRKWTIILTLMITVVAICGGTWLWMTYAPQYQAEAYLEVNPPKGTFQDNVMPPQEYMDRLVMQQASLLLTQMVLDTACNDPRIRNTDWFRQHTSNAPQLLEKEMGVSQMPKTNLIRLTFTGRNRKDLPEIVNAVAATGIEVARTTLMTESSIALKEISENLTRFNEELKRLQNDLTNLIASMPVNAAANNNDLSMQLQALLPEFNRLQSERDEIGAQFKEMSAAAQVPGKLESSPMIQGMVREDRMLQQLDAQEKGLSIELEDLMRRFGPNHLSVQKMQGRIDGIRKEKQETEQVIAKQAAAGILMQLDMALKKKTQAMIVKRTKIDELLAEHRDLQTLINRSEELKNQIEEKKKDIKRYDERLTELRTGVKMTPPFQMRRPAIEPKDIYMPRWKIMAPVAVVMGLILGFGLAILLELMDTSIKSPSDVSRRVDLPLLGIVPHADDIDDEIADLRLAYASNPHSLLGEMFRQIRTSLMFSGPANARRSVLVTSPMPEDGSSTVTLNLAAAMARGGRKVLVVDANFRQPVLRTLFPQAGESGLSSVLVGQAKWQDTVCQIEPGLSVMPSGPLPPNPADLLGSDQMRQLIDEMVTQYDQVIFDGAPCMIVSDAAVLGRMVDGVVLTVRAGKNTHGIVQRSRDSLAKVGAHMLGVVLNGVRVTAGGYLRKNYETFYEYHTQAQLPPK